MKIAKMLICMSQPGLTKEIDYTQDDSLSDRYYSLSKSNAIIIEKQFYLEKEDNMIGCIVLNYLLLELAPKKMPGFIDTEEH